MCMGRGWGVEGLVRLHVPSPLRVMVTQLTAPGPAPDHTAWAQKGLLGPTHAHGAAHCPTTPLRHLHCPLRQGPGPYVRAAWVLSWGIWVWGRGHWSEPLIRMGQGAGRVRAGEAEEGSQSVEGMLQPGAQGASGDGPATAELRSPRSRAELPQSPPGQAQPLPCGATPTPHPWGRSPLRRKSRVGLLWGKGWPPATASGHPPSTPAPQAPTFLSSISNSSFWQGWGCLRS